MNDNDNHCASAIHLVKNDISQSSSLSEGERHIYESVIKTSNIMTPQSTNKSYPSPRKKQPPFLKWPGGKRWFVEKHPEFLPKNIKGRYIEPFLGSGVIFFALTPDEAILADACQDLINTYVGISDQPSRVFKILKVHAIRHNKEYYYKVRSSEPKNLAARAARFIYLNRTCFNGIYRVNNYGKFNVPIGSKTKVILEYDDFLSWSDSLQRAQIFKSDFEPIIDEARKSDFVFVDPPYTLRHNNNGFIRYNEILFSWHDQVRLYECLNRARSRGVQILMTNANHQSLRKLYSKGFNQFVTSRYSSIAASREKRDTYEELIIHT